ncbi:MAG: hypothetical protein LUE63_04695 [Lachnospiraceae bacterium]|nr:hypothetical protein [Lachnospiraceae bacterium]
MNYEDLYQSLLPDEKSLKDTVSSLQKLYKTVSRETENGDIKGLSRDLNTLKQTAEALLAVIQNLEDSVEAFDAKAYFESGDFASQVLDLCQEMELDVQGEFPVYEMFPYRVRIDVENQDVYLDRKRIPCMRPSSFVKTVKAGQDKLKKASFNAQGFAAELADAYDLAVLKLRRKPESDIYLTNLYKILAPMSRFRRDYDMQSFSYDIARLYAEFMNGMTETRNGRSFDFGPTRFNRRAIRILDANGKEQFLATIRFFDKQEETK